MGASAGALGTSRSTPEMITAPSPLGQAGVQFGFDDTKENAKGAVTQKMKDHYLTLVYKNRRESDVTLVGILLDPNLAHVFRNYLYKHFKEALFNFWTECNSYTQIHAGNTETKKAAAAHIYQTFLAPGAAYSTDFQLDAPTRDQIAADLKITKSSNGEYKAKQSSENVLQDVFRFPAGKVFQILKFDYLSEFLLSDDFQDQLESFQNQLNENNSRSAAEARKSNVRTNNELVDIETVIKQPSGMHFFLKFARANGLFAGKAQFVFDLLYEMNHYDETDDPATKMKRLKKIIQRYQGFDFLMEIQALIKTAKKNNFKEPENDGQKRSMLDELRTEIMQLLDNYAVPFKMSAEYRDYKAAKTEAQSENTFNKIRRYAKDRNLEPQARITFDELLNNRIGRAYFKEYAIKNLMEESIEFWLAIQELKRVLAERAKSKDTQEDQIKFLQDEAQKIVTSYIDEGSPKQVNISDGQRANTLAAFSDMCSANELKSDIFDVAEREILDLMKRNLWNGFRANKQFAYLSEKLLEKDKKKKSNFGQTMLNLPT